MVLSEKDPEDKQRLKNGIVGVVILLVLGSISPMIIGEFTGIDLDELCEEDEEGSECVERIKNQEIKSTLQEALGYVSIVIAIVGFVGLVIVGVKY